MASPLGSGGSLHLSAKSSPRSTVGDWSGLGLLALGPIFWFGLIH